MISVLMSVYKNDRPEWLKQSLDSLFDQTLKADEIIIVKDGPLTQDLEQVLSDYKDSSIKYVVFNENKGQEEALKQGLLACQHEFIARMDSDDISHKDRFQLQYNTFIKEPHLDVVGASIIEFDHDISDATTIRKLPVEGDELIKYSKRRSPTNHAAVMFRKSAVLSAGNYQNFLWNEDYHLWARMMMNGAKFKNLEQVLLYVRGGKSMYQRRGGWKYAKQDIKLQFKLYQIGFLNSYQMITNLAIRVPIRLFPNSLRRWLYESFLRKI